MSRRLDCVNLLLRRRELFCNSKFAEKVLSYCHRQSQVRNADCHYLSTMSVADPIQDDDPCWGSPTQCDLKHLLSQISKETAIRYESPNYCVLQKPPDLRMDGPYRATVHKLLTYWYPPPSIAKDKNNLLETISTLHQHNSLADNELRCCHQLDYATSGILCVARTREAAHYAIQQWEDRQVQKTYLAVLGGGSLNFENESWPVLTKQEMETKIQQLEQSYRAKKRRLRNATKPKDTTFQGYQPPQALFHKYKSIVKNNNTNNDNNNNPNKKKKRKRSLLTAVQWDQVWEPVRQVIPNHMVAELDWKKLGPHHQQQGNNNTNNWKEAFEQAADIHNSFLREQQTAVEMEQLAASSLPTIFRVQEEASTAYIYCPLAQDKEEFAMKIPPDVAQMYPQHWLPAATTSCLGDAASLTSTETLDFKPSLTKCSLVETARYHHQLDDDDKESTEVVTKVKLWPVTGRRHQLRVHTALLGHAILGDNTYANNKNNDDSKRRSYPRMCLHAYSLRLKLLPTTQDDDGEITATEITTQDPFVVQDGKLELQVL